MLKAFLTFYLTLTFILPLTAQEVDYTEHLDLAYAKEEGNPQDTLRKLNLVLPTAQDKPPLFIWIGGGAWSFVDRNVELPLARQFAQEGIAVATIGHRLSSGVWKDPERTTGVKHPAHIMDLALAVRWLIDQADEYGYDSNRVVVGGFSSGAHLAALISLDHSYLEAVDLDKSVLKGVIPVAGAYDIDSYYHGFLNSENSQHLAEQHVQAVFGETKKHFELASPTSYVSNISVPMLLMSEPGTYDYTKILEDLIKKEKFTAFDVVHIEEFDHAGLWRHLSNAGVSKYRDMMVEFIQDPQQTTNP